MLFSNFETHKFKTMNWNKLDKIEILEEIKTQSLKESVLIFKHSTSCSISATALSRLERKWDDTKLPKLSPYYLDLLRYRDISNQIAQTFGVEHQSPQILLIEKGKCVYHTSHLAISWENIVAEVSKS